MPVNPAYVMQVRGDHPAQLFRMALAGVSTGPAASTNTVPKGGVSPLFGGGFGVSGQSSMQVQIATGLAYVANSSAWNGSYACYQNATYTIPIAAASSSQWRQDYIAIVVTDAGDSNAAWDIVDVQGANSSSAPGSLPSLPANALPLAIVKVTPNMSVTNGAGTVNDARTYSPLPGPLPTVSTGRPISTVPSGTMWYESDTQSMGMMVNGTPQYFVISPGTIDVWHPLGPGNTGWLGSVTGEYPAQYRFNADQSRLELFGAVQIKGSGTINDTPIFANNLPTNYRPPVAIRDSLVLEGQAGTTPKPPQCVLHSDGSVRFEGIDGQFGQVAFMNCSFPMPSGNLVPHL